MEISRQQFRDELPAIKAAIDECDFIALDTELSGLHRPGTSKRIDSLANRYAEYREATERFIITQFGMCTFKWDQPSGRYIAKAFNFYIFPTSMTGRIQPNRVFMCQAQALDFLSKQAFDFNKWVYQGVPYLTVAEEKAYMEEARKKLNDELPDIPIDDKERPFLQAAKDKIDAWIADPKDDVCVNITTKNAYQRRLIYQEVRKSYSGLTAEGRGGFILIQRLTEKQLKQREKERKKRLEEDCEQAIGFRKVIDWISASKKIVVGHNMLLDICHVIAQFIQPLPPKVQDFKKLAHDIFPHMIDTKYVSSAAAELQQLLGTATSLDVLTFETRREAFKNPRIDMDWLFSRYISDKAHEAGYDAYITGSVLLKLFSFLDAQQHPEKYKEPEEPAPTEDDDQETGQQNKEWDISDTEEEPDPNWTNDDDEEEVHNYGSIKVPLMTEQGTPTEMLAPYVNKVTMVRTGWEYFDFVDTEAIIEQHNTFIVHCKDKTVPRDTVFNIFSAHGKPVLDALDEQTVMVIYEKLQEDQQHIMDKIKTQVSEDPECQNFDLLIETVAQYHRRIRDL
ncbi:CAF1 family ribonuclease-domain-containing protein [Radiomyces spectabilis]|uniref:CAF1 family ribonuclease-domain-containing protein n=1 Tax=Radiomyces spectabilis TaxID=64574 RepID=UPI0022205B36|nr:CAF1 family ribonuclease-domain-containing protein [Radiomyces spectabilis]KAI8367533.1 CAF1 family ribonuclease-domain-containing protein [Radiomyces spectabilis]